MKRQKTALDAEAALSNAAVTLERAWTKRPDLCAAMEHPTTLFMPLPAAPKSGFLKLSARACPCGQYTFTHRLMPDGTIQRDQTRSPAQVSLEAKVHRCLLYT